MDTKRCSFVYFDLFLLIIVLTTTHLIDKTSKTINNICYGADRVSGERIINKNYS